MDFNYSLVADNFSNKVEDYLINAKIQKIVANKISIFINQYFNFQNSDTANSIKANAHILDIGSGAGFVFDNLKKNFKNKFNHHHFYELDLSLKMLKKSPQHLTERFQICGDFNFLPFQNQSFDLITSSFALQWSDDLALTLKKIYDILKQNGLLIIALPTSESFRNFSNLPFRINKMPDAFKIKKILNKSGLVEKFYFQETCYEKFDNSIQALKYFKKIGANYILRNLDESDLNDFRKLRNFYLKNYQTNLSFEIDWAISYFIYSKNV
ncbi:MAG: methyltransferase domain-containing protein [Alphaproteobacteria bacterium]|nr:methyltransferase domain-containing protein [Alphaproteobacteria bacterium]